MARGPDERERSGKNNALSRIHGMQGQRDDLQVVIYVRLVYV
jgi:hypothetical protein